MAIRQRDIDAIRLGVEEQTRRDVSREFHRQNWERLTARVHVQEVELRHARSLRVGDVLAECSFGYTFFEAGKIEDIVVNATPEGGRIHGDICVVTPGSRRALKDDDLVLIKRRA